MKFNDNFTTKKQSEALITLGLPPATADCFYDHFGYKNVRDSGLELSEDFFSSTEKYFDKHEGAFPCWSVGRLIEILKECILDKSELEEIFEYLKDCVFTVDTLLQIYKEWGDFIDFSKLEE